MIGGATIVDSADTSCLATLSDSVLKQELMKRTGVIEPPLSGNAPEAEKKSFQDLHHQDPLAYSQRTPAAGIADCHACWAARADQRAVDDQCIGARCGAALVENRVEPQRAAIGNESSGAGNAAMGNVGAGRPGVRR